MSPPIDERVVIARPVAEVFAFVADFENLPRFCATSAEVHKVTPGAIGRGTVFRQVFAMYGWRLDTPVELVAFEPGRSLTYQAERGPRVRGTCTFTRDPAGTSGAGAQRRDPTAPDSGTCLRYNVEIQPRGAYKLFAPLLVKMLRAQTRNDLGKLKQLLEARPVPVQAPAEVQMRP
jgi:hypothetical protein